MDYRDEIDIKILIAEAIDEERERIKSEQEDKNLQIFKYFVVITLASLFWVSIGTIIGIKIVS